MKVGGGYVEILCLLARGGGHVEKVCLHQRPEVGGGGMLKMSGYEAAGGGLNLKK